MKTKLIVLFVLLTAAVSVSQAQSKKDLESDYAKCIIAKDSLQKSYTGLSAAHESLNKTYDSINKIYLVYDSMYRVIKARLILYDFEPENMPKLLDSLRASRDLAMSGITSIYNDSIAALKEENTRLQATVDSLAIETSDKTDVVTQLKQLKELFDSGILTQEEFDARKAKLLDKL